MPPGDNNQQLVQGVHAGRLDIVKAAVQAGADVDGTPELKCTPVVTATIAGDVGIVDYLIGQGADPDRPVLAEMAYPSGLNSEFAKTVIGECALHLAAWAGQVEIVRLLLKQAHADPNVTDNTSRTPLMAACQSPQVYEREVVRLLLETGADPALANEDGLIPLHYAALRGYDMDLVDMLHSRAPATLTHCGARGQTALFAACSKGHDNMVSKLLSLGATQQMYLDDRRGMCPLIIAVRYGFLGVVRVLIDEGGIKAVGGDIVLPQAMCIAVCYGRARILRLLLMVHGEERRSKWANASNVEGRRQLHDAAGYCSPAAVSVLLEAGADEAAFDSQGRIPRDVIGADLAGEDKVLMDPGKEVAIRRMLQRGPAYRARSWAWPSEEEADSIGSGDDGDTTAAAAAPAATTAVVLSSPPSTKPPPVIVLRIFRPKEESRSKFFMRLVGRYCAKD